MYDRRWYDSNESTQRALEILKDMDESQRRALSKDLTTVVKQIKELHEDINYGRSVYNRLTSHTKSKIMSDQFCCGFNYDQWLIWNSEPNKQTDDSIINELCEKINEICCPPKMKQRYGLVNNEQFEYYIRTKLRTCKVTRDQAIQMYYFYIHSLAPSGDNVGMKASLAISEAFTQAGLNSIHKASGGGVNVERLRRSAGLDRFNELLGGSTHKNTVFTFGFIDNTKETAEQFAREQETVYFSELWNKLEVIIGDKLPDIIYKLHPTIDKKHFKGLSISPKYLRLTLDLVKIANYEIKLSKLIKQIYTSDMCLVTGYVCNKNEMALYIFFDNRLTQKKLDAIINKWKMKVRDNIICGSYLCNCFVTKNVNDGSWLVLANETDPNNKTMENLIYHPALDVAKCKSSNIETTQGLFGVFETESRLFEELYYAATNLSDTKNILERHYKTITDICNEANDVYKKFKIIFF